METNYKIYPKTNLKFLPLFLVILIMGFSCQKDNIDSSSCKECSQAIFIQKFNNINGTLKQVSDIDYVFNESSFYILVDAEVELPDLYSKNPQEKFIKVFSCSKMNFNIENKDKAIKISGKLYNCTTGDHGRQTNNLHTFKIFY